MKGHPAYGNIQENLRYNNHWTYAKFQAQAKQLVFNVQRDMY